MIIFSQQALTIRALEDEDAHLLVKWLSDPVVLEFYEGRDHPLNEELVRESFYEDNDEVNRCIIQYNGVNIGYIQFYVIDDEEKEAYSYSDYNGIIYGMDQFIGEPHYWNKGIGSLLITATVQYLIDFKGANKIVMDPQAWNMRALRVYEKSGFKKKKYLEKHEWHEGELRDCWLIEYDAERVDGI